jgi:hypothetical protein
LIAVAEEENISRAAKRLFVAQPSLSIQLKSMEDALSIELLVRVPKGVKLTPAAEVLTAGAVDLQKAQVNPIQNQQTEIKEPPMANSREHSQEELCRQTLPETIIHAPENISNTADIEHRHNAPIQTALPNEASDYAWKRETGEVQSYQHNRGGSWLHIDPQGQFYDRQAQPITRETALEQAGQTSAYSLGDNGQMLPSSKISTDLGLGL